jgi:hypothetical protein
MGYHVQQHDAIFAITRGKEEEALTAVLAVDAFGVYKIDDLKSAFYAFGWGWSPWPGDENSDDMYMDSDRFNGDTGLFMETLAPFVVEGSSITLIGEDLNIWRYYFKGGECLEQQGDITFSEGTLVPAKRSMAGEWTPPGVEKGEVFIDTVGGEKVVFPSAVSEPDGASYVRIVDERGVELVLWNSEEWAEAPEEVMGAILGAMSGGAKV